MALCHFVGCGSSAVQNSFQGRLCNSSGDRHFELLQMCGASLINNTASTHCINLKRQHPLMRCQISFRFMTQSCINQINTKNDCSIHTSVKERRRHVDNCWRVARSDGIQPGFVFRPTDQTRQDSGHQHLHT